MSIKIVGDEKNRTQIFRDGDNKPMAQTSEAEIMKIREDFWKYILELKEEISKLKERIKVLENK